MATVRGVAEANAAQAHHWNFEAGPGWVAKQEQHDRMLEPLGDRALAAARPSAGERAIDIGCGCGATTIALAQRVGTDGRVLGVDISEPMLERARERCDALGLTNVELLRADAQRALVPRGNDLAFSRFGIMFFDDPVAALGNIGRGLRKDGRLAFVCWQERGRNPWMGIPVAAALQHVPPPPPQPPDAPGPWAFADRDRLAGILDAAGFADVAIESVEHDLLVGGAADLDGGRWLLDRVRVDAQPPRRHRRRHPSARGRLDPGRVRAVRHLRRGADPLGDLGGQRATGGLVTETHLHRRQRVMGALVGAIVGDALAAPFAAEPPGAFTARSRGPCSRDTARCSMAGGGQSTRR